MAVIDKAKKTVAMIGYGSQGRALALNLRDSGYEIVVGLRPRSKSRRLAVKERFKQVCSIPEASKRADIICMAFPDHLHARVFARSIRGSLPPRGTLWFLHGMSVAFGLLKLPDNCDTILLAPHAPGQAVRDKYLGDKSLSAFFAIEQNVSRQARQTVLALAGAAGFQRQRLIDTTFKAEAIGDIFGEQVVLCGGLAALIKNGFELLVENGIKPDHAYLEVAYQLDLIVALIKKHGIEGMLKRISVTARYGSLKAGPTIINNSTRKRMSRILREITSGKFAEQLGNLSAGDVAALKKQAGRLSHPDLEKAAKKFSR